MKYKVTTMTPIHISTGELNGSYMYDMGKDYHLNCYSIENLIHYIPPKKILDINYLDKNRIINIFRSYVKYEELTPKYSVYCYDQFPFKENISVQVKSLGKPYIPGSTIKGAIMNAIIYGILKEKEQQVIDVLESKEIHPKYFESNLFEYLFDKQFNEIFNIFSSCVICDDLFFDDMILCSDIRLNMNSDKKKNDQKFTKYECIDINQINENILLRIDNNKKNILKMKVERNQKYEMLLKYLNEMKIAEVCRNLYSLIVENEKEYFVEDCFGYFAKSDFEERTDIIDFLESLSLEDKNVFYLRLGNSTNYFYKTVSIFIKNNIPVYYKEKFENIFSPIGKNKKAKYDKMPKTRTVFKFDDECYLPGYIKVELYNEN